jgi:hypothetical protein
VARARLWQGRALLRARRDLHTSASPCSSRQRRVAISTPGGSAWRRATSRRWQRAP